MRYLAILVVMLPSAVWADDCTRITEALAKQANTSFRVVYSGRNLDKSGQCKSAYAGLSRHNAGEPSYTPYEQSADAFPKVSDCGALGATIITRAAFDPQTPTRTAAEHFYITVESDGAEKLISELWISPETGLILKRSESRPDKTTTVQYEYNNLNSIF